MTDFKNEATAFTVRPPSPQTTLKHTNPNKITNWPKNIYRSLNAACLYAYIFIGLGLIKFEDSLKWKMTGLICHFVFTIIALLFSLSGGRSNRIVCDLLLNLSISLSLSLWLILLSDLSNAIKYLYVVHPFGKWFTMDFWTLAYGSLKKIYYNYHFSCSLCACLTSIDCELGQTNQQWIAKRWSKSNFIRNIKQWMECGLD